MTGARRPIALVTGASSGIGYALADVFAANGHDLVLVARSADRLEKTAADLKQRWGADCTVITADLSAPGAAAVLHRSVLARGIVVDVLVNNAGSGTFGLFAEGDVDTYVNEMQLNVVTTGHLTRLFLEPMVARGSGKILNVASVGGFVSGPMLALYYATKSFVLHLSEALYEEAKGKGVTVTALCPGPTHSEFHARAEVRDTPSARRLYATAEEVARAGYRGLTKGKALVVPGLINKLVVAVVRYGPRAWVRRRVFAKQRRRIVE